MKTKSVYFLLLVAMLTLTSVSANAFTGFIPLEVRYNDPTGHVGDPHRNPILVPEVSLDGYTLYFNTPCDSCTLRIIDESGIVVYSTVIPVGCDELALPSYLSGEYEIQIDFGPYYVVGLIELEDED